MSPSSCIRLNIMFQYHDVALSTSQEHKDGMMALENYITDLFFTEIPEDDFISITLYEQYAAAAYCNNNNRGPVPQRITCPAPASNCPRVEAAGATIIRKFSLVISRKSYPDRFA